jgi:hypothetical protein
MIPMKVGTHKNTQSEVNYETVLLKAITRRLYRPTGSLGYKVISFAYH